MSDQEEEDFPEGAIQQQNPDQPAGNQQGQQQNSHIQAGGNALNQNEQGHPLVVENI